MDALIGYGAIALFLLITIIAMERTRKPGASFDEYATAGRSFGTFCGTMAHVNTFLPGVVGRLRSHILRSEDMCILSVKIRCVSSLCPSTGPSVAKGQTAKNSPGSQVTALISVWAKPAVA